MHIVDSPVFLLLHGSRFLRIISPSNSSLRAKPWSPLGYRNSIDRKLDYLHYSKPPILRTLNIPVSKFSDG
jgi:hypothetical protein